MYTISTGHSGSTLLDLLIGSIRGVFATGALNCIMWQVFRNGVSEPSVEKEDICTCLNSFRKCVAWSKIFHVLGDKLGFDVMEDPLRFRIPLMRHPFWGYRSLIRDMDYKVYQRLELRGRNALAASFFHWKYSRTIRNNWLLIDSIAEAMDVRYVSDSSKDFVRMSLLRSRRPQDVVLVLLIRDLYGVANSYQHGLGSKSTKDFSLGGFCDSYVRFYNRVARYCRAQGIDPIIVRYETLAQNPEGLRHALAQRLNLSVSGALHLDTRNHHLVAGNPMRYKGELEIRYDDKWNKQLDDRQRHVIRKKIDELDPIYTTAWVGKGGKDQRMEDTGIYF